MLKVHLLRLFATAIQPTRKGWAPARHAAALAGALGTSLLAMVARLPKPRVRDEEEAHRLTAAGTQAAAISDQLAALMDRDSDAYDLVVAACRLPKGSEEEARGRRARIQEALRSATEAPLEVMRACHEALLLAAIVAAHGNRNASSDVQVAVELLRAGLRGAKLNVDVNLASIADNEFAGSVRTEAERLKLEGEQRAAAFGSAE